MCLAASGRELNDGRDGRLRRIVIVLGMRKGCTKIKVGVLLFRYGLALSVAPLCLRIAAVSDSVATISEQILPFLGRE